VRVLTAKWDTANRVSPIGTITGESETAAEPARAEKPLFIYVTDGADTEDFDKVEKVILDDNKVILGLKVFKTIKMTPEAVAGDPFIADAGKTIPRFILVSCDYSKIEVIEDNKMKTKKVYDAMKKFARREYKTNFDKNIKAMLKLLLEFDKINNAKKTLLAKKEREGDNISKAEAKKIAEELAELEERQKEADAEFVKLMTFEVRV